MDHLLLTRRQTLQSLAYSAVLGGSLLGLVGCGGGGGHHGGSSTNSANVAVQLPSGFPIAATDLQAGTAYGTSTLGSGSFKAKVSSKGPTFAYLQQKSTGAYVLVGLVGDGRPGLSALSSAALAVALALGITGLPAKNLSQALTLLEADGNVQTLATTISTTMASDPLCLTNGNATVAAAIQAAVAAIGGAAPAVAGPVARASAATRVLVQPTGDLGGAEVLQGDDEATIVPTNTKRRPISAYTYLVGHVDANGNATAVSPATRVDEQDVPATSSILGSIASLGVKGAFGPVSGKAVALSVSSGDTKTLYETVVLMATGDNSAADPAFFSDPKYANEVAGWRTQLETLNLSAFVGGILFDLFNAVLAGGATAASVTQVSAAVAALGAAEAAAANGILSAARLGKYGDAAQFLLTKLTSNDLLATTRYKYRQAILELIGESETAAATAAEGAQGIAVTGLAAVALAALTAVGTLTGVADVAASYFDALSSPKGELWTETAVVPSVVVSPATGNVYPGGFATLTAATPGASETLYKFHWTLSSGGNGNLGDPTDAVKPGRDITTAGNSVTLATAPSDAGGVVYSVSVTAIELKTGAALGTAKAVLTISPEDPGQVVSVFTKSGATPSGEHFAWAFVPFQPVPGKQFYSAVGLKPDGTAVGDGFVSTDAFPYLLPDGTTLTDCVCVYGSPGAAGTPPNGDSTFATADQATYYLNQFLQFVSGATYHVYAH